MTTYLMYGKYSAEALKEISIHRTDRAVRLVEQFGGQVKDIYATLGEHDLVFIVDMPDAEAAIKASVALTKLTGIQLLSTPAVPVEEFDRIMSEI